MSGRIRPGPSEALDLARRMGVRWTVARAAQALKARAGVYGRRFPPRPLAAWGLDLVAPGVRRGDVRAALETAAAPLPGGQRGDPFRAALREALGPPGSAALRGAAEEAAAGRLRRFGGPPGEPARPFPWRCHPTDGREWPLARWDRLPDMGGVDVKPLWEPGRFAFAWPLARRWRADGDAAAAETFWSLWEEFLADNPPGLGPHWMCGQETGYRVLAVCFAVAATLDAPAATEARVVAAVEALAAHGERIEATLDRARLQKNNHGLNEALALLAVAAYLPFLRAAPRWDGLGRSVLAEETARQVYGDGSYVQGSLGYHRLAVESLSLATAIATGTGRPLEGSVREGLRRLARFLLEVTDPVSGTLPTAGSTDSSRLFDLAVADPRDARPSLLAGLVLADDPPPEVPPSAGEALLWLRPPPRELARNIPGMSSSRSRGLGAREGGWHTVGSGETWGLLRCGPQRDRPAQADMLHLSVMWRGHEVVGDPGTFSYDGPPPWDNGLAAARVHDGPCLDGHDPMDRGPRFLWFRWTEGRLLAREDAGPLRRLDGEHDGYLRRFGAVVRRVVLLAGDGPWIVVDELRGAGARRASSQWLFPRASVEALDGGAARLATPAGPLAAAFLSVAADGTGVLPRVALHEGHADDVLGWWAPRYGAREAAPALVVEDGGPLPRLRVAVLDPGARCALRRVPGAVLAVDGPAGTVEVRWTPGGRPGERGAVAATLTSATARGPVP